ncbi:MAG: LptE family protein [Syntrophaceae bacterium]|nr:LptE family protein [Syntrophaceae bacterium]
MKKKIGKPLIRAFLLGCFVATVIACGYAFSPQGEYIDKKIQKIYVGQFDNKTSQADMENYVRTAFIDQFIQTQRFKVVETEEAADAVVKGSVAALTTSPLSYRGSTVAAEERATMTLELTFREKESGKDIWKTQGISGTVDYTIEGDVNLQPTTRKTAFIKLANDTAEKTFNQMMSGF